MRKRRDITTPCSDNGREARPQGYFSCCDPAGEAPLNKGGVLRDRALNELCAEIAGALIRGYADGKSGSRMRAAITTGIQERMGCSRSQAASLVDLSLELIHHAAYGTFRCSELELDLLVSRTRGEGIDLRLN